jgi:3-oxoacyl-[acyl-carrier protein] reductase
MKRRHRRILVTGASRGIGREAALALARRGDRVVLAARDERALASLAEEIRAEGGAAEVAPVDVTDDRSVALAAERVLAEGPLDVLVNNAGRASQLPFVAQPLADARAELEVNYLGALRMTHAFLPSMLSARSGVIVNVSSLLGAVPAPASANYSATKAALNAWSYALRGEVASRGVKVVVFMPSHTATEAGAATEFRGIYLLPVQYVAKELLRAIDRTPRAYVSSPVYRMFVRLAGIFPAWADGQMLKTTAHALEAPAARGGP